MANGRPLPAEVLILVLERLSHHDIVLGGRLACKDAARYFHSARHRNVRLSQELPPHAADSFQLNAQPHMRLLSFNKKLCLMTAAAAVNMAVAWALLRPHLFPELLRPQSCRYGSLEFVYPEEFADGEDPGRAACEQGHPHLVHWMVQHSCPLSPIATLVAAAQHCDLSTLRELWDLLRQMPGAPRKPTQDMLEAAAASSTPDTLQKMEWLLAEGAGNCRLSSYMAAKAIGGAARSCSSIASHEYTPVAVEAVMSRLRYFKDKGCGLFSAAAIGAAMRLPLGVALELADFILNEGDGVAEAEAAEAEGEEQEQGQGQGGGTEDAGAGVEGRAGSGEREGGRGREQAVEQAGPDAAGGSAGGDDGDEGEEDNHPLTDPEGVDSVVRGTVGSADSVEKLRWLQGRGLHLPREAVEQLEEDPLVLAAWAGDLEAVCYLHECGQPLSSGVFVAAAGSGSVPMAAWLLQAGCPMAAEAYTAAARRGSVDMVRWLLEEARCPRCSLEDLVDQWARHRRTARGQPCSADGTLPAALQLFLRDGAATCDRAFLAAVDSGELEPVKLLLHRGPGGRLPRDALMRAAAAGCEAVVEYVVEVDNTLLQTVDETCDPCTRPAARGDLGTLIVLRRLGAEWCQESLRKAVHARAHLCVLKWMVGQGMPAPVELLREVWKSRTWASGADEVWDWVRELAGENWVSGEDSDDGVPPWFRGGNYRVFGIGACGWLV